MTAIELRNLMRSLGYDPDIPRERKLFAARVLGCSDRSLRRWLAGMCAMSPALERLLLQAAGWISLAKGNQDGGR